MTFASFDAFFLKQRVAEANNIIRSAINQSSHPLVVNFSGGRDSMAMLSLAKKQTDYLVCCYNVTGIEFPEAIDFARWAAQLLSAPLAISYPQDHKGDFFQRLEMFRRFPTMVTPWCQRDLKTRSEAKMLRREYGKGTFYKLVGVRRWESSRRHSIYARSGFIRPDGDSSGFLVYPLVNWRDDDVANYLKAEGLPTSGLYPKYGVSGCYYCPFYPPELYLRVMKHEPNLYDRFIEWENILHAPAVQGQNYLRDLKAGLEFRQTLL